MDQEELQYEEVVEAGDGGDENFVGAAEDEHQLNDTDQSIETELEAIKARVREMEEEAEKIRQIQSEVDKQMSLGSPPGAAGATSPLNMSIEEKMEVDARSIYVGNVDYGATAEELEQHFHGCGAVNRVTILCNKYDGHPKGFAYIEFAEKDSVQMAMALDESLFRGRQLKVMPKRTNKPGISTSNRPPRGVRIARGRGRFYSGYRPTRRPSRLCAPLCLALPKQPALREASLLL
ncbi:polyadenylate-binding protein 2-like isoform X1 [Eriocheir sinensis]|uniref:polyadenylate-binding protein 2-like isoform X1 n=1 Tax=Eriocheir sinensis TaxID=95602 RepID=UPI0021C9A816|nr:polyadenylate-binding protein 2-like isoform X1 [Eriocheir sinensis]